MTRGFWIALWLAALAAELIALRPAVFERDAPIQGVEVVLRWSAARSPPSGSWPGGDGRTAAAAR